MDVFYNVPFEVKKRFLRKNRFHNGFSSLPILKDLRRQVKPVLLKRQRVEPRLLKRRMPSLDELSALDDAIRRAKQERIVWEQDEIAEGASRRDQIDNLSSFNSLQRAFLDQHEKDILHDFGPHVSLEPAPLANRLQSKFLDAAKEVGSVPSLGYYWTTQENNASIFRQGLHLPGHGMGIQTGKGGSLQQHYPRASCCQNMLIVGVVEGAQKASNSSAQVVKGPKYHRRSSKARFGPKYFYGQRVHSDDGAVRDLGKCLMIFDTTRVMPLFVAKDVSHDAVRRAGRDKVVVTESGESVWAPPEAFRFMHAMKAKRRVVGKERDLHRARQRDAKATEMAGPQ
jgi:hypothetical protein